MIKPTYVVKALSTIALATSLSLAAQAEGTVHATVNGVKITDSMYRGYLTTLPPRQQTIPDSPQKTQAVVEGIIRNEILIQEATAQKLEDRADIKAQLKIVRDRALAKLVMQDYVDRNPPSEQQLKAVYDGLDGDGVQYKARHILLKTEQAAQQVIAELDKGGKFVELAKQKSTGPSAAAGGDLGWFAPQQMVPAFSAAVQELKKGAHTATAVKTRFGFHVILLEDTRQEEKKGFDELKVELEGRYNRQLVDGFLQGLISKAKIERNY